MSRRTSRNKKRRGGSRIPFAPSTGRPTARPAKESCHLLTRDYTDRYREPQGLGAHANRRGLGDQVRVGFLTDGRTQFSLPAHQLWICSDRILESLSGLIGGWKFFGMDADPNLQCLGCGGPIVGGGNNAEDERRHAEHDPPPVPGNGRLGLKARQHRSARRGRRGRKCNG